MLPQFLLRPLPQLLLQPLIPRPLTPRRLLPNRHIIPTILQLCLVHRSTPRRIQRATLWSLIMAGQKQAKDAINPKSQFQKHIRTHTIEQIGKNDSGMQRHASDLRVLFRQGASKENICEFRGAVAAQRTLVL